MRPLAGSVTGRPQALPSTTRDTTADTHTQHNQAQNNENNNTQRPKPSDPLDTAPLFQG
jgi:hypothetical protein